jgi:hypothetical protein
MPMRTKNGVDRRALAGLICREPRGFHKGAKLAGAKPIGKEHREIIIAARSKARAELEASDSRQ